MTFPTVVLDFRVMPPEVVIPVVALIESVMVVVPVCENVPPVVVRVMAMAAEGTTVLS